MVEIYGAANLQSILPLAVRFVDTYVRASTCRYLSGSLVNCYSFELLIRIVVDCLQQTLRPIENNKGISGDVSLGRVLACPDASLGYSYNKPFVFPSACADSLELSRYSTRKHSSHLSMANRITSKYRWFVRVENLERQLSWLWWWKTEDALLHQFSVSVG